MDIKLKSKNNISLIIILTLIVFSLLVSLYFISFRIVVSQILNRADSDTNNLISLIEKYDSTELAIDNFNSSRDLEIVIVDENYQVLESSRDIFRSSFFSTNITGAKSEGVAYSFIKTDIGKKLALIYSKKGFYKGDLIIVSIEYPFISYLELKNIFVLFLLLSFLIIAFDTYFITVMYINSYILNLNRFVKTNQIYNDLNNDDLKLPLNSENKEVLRLIETLNSYKAKYDAILENDKNRFSKINSFLSNIPTGILVIDNDGKISLMNEKVHFFLSLSKRQILEPANTKGLEQIFEIWEKVVEDQKIRINDIEINNKILEIESHPMIDKYSPYEFIGVLFLIRDVTKIRELDNMKNDFVSNVSHELRTPLTIISGFAQTLKNENIDNEDRELCIDSINSEVEKLTTLISELLKLSKIDKAFKNVKHTFFNPTEIIKEQVALFFTKANEKNINIQFELENKMECVLLSNELYYRQIFNNLLDNAIKYSKDDSSIIIREAIDNEFYSFSIEDHGIGISNDEIDKIFDRFYRIEKSRNSEIAGSGLGLSIVKQFVNALAGEIEVSSKLGLGSTFTIKIKRNNDV